jgi:hypothetical protein
MHREPYDLLLSEYMVKYVRTENAALLSSPPIPNIAASKLNLSRSKAVQSYNILTLHRI